MHPETGTVGRPWCSTYHTFTSQKQVGKQSEFSRTSYFRLRKATEVWKGTFGSSYYVPQLWLTLGDLKVTYVVVPPSMSKSTLSGGLTRSHRLTTRFAYPSKTAVPNGLVEELPSKNTSHKVLA